MAKLTLPAISTGFKSATKINADYDLIEAAVENTLSRDGTSPNSMAADLDMNNNDILNAATINGETIVVGGVDLSAQVDAAAASATAAATSETNAATSETNASGSATAAAASAALIADWDFVGTWGTSTAYLANNVVAVNDGGSHDGWSAIALSDHTSDASAFDTDFTGGKWGVIAKKGGSGAGAGDLIAANNLSDVVSASASRTNLGLIIGTTIQAEDAGLTSIAGLTTLADRMIYTTASDTYAVTTLTAAGRTLISQASALAGFNTLSPVTTQGDIIFRDSTNNVRLAKGTAAQVLTMNAGATAPEWAVAAGGTNINLGTEQATTSGTAIDFTGLPSDVKRIKINFNAVSTTGSSNLIVQLGDSGGVETTGYVGLANEPNISSLNPTTGLPATTNHGATGLLHGALVIEKQNSSNAWTSSSIIVDRATNRPRIGGGSKTLSGTLDRIRLTTVGGLNTFDSGAVNITYES